MVSRFRLPLLLTLGALVLAVGLVPATAAPGTWQVDPVHSTVLFRVKHAGVAYVYGRFNEFEGSIVFDEENPSASTVEMTVQVTSVDTGNEKRDQHLRSPDFFNVNQFPTMTFQSTAVSKKDGDRYEVEGDLTLHGTTKPVTIVMTKTGQGPGPHGGELIGFEGATKIQRSEFGMDKMQAGISDTIWFTVSIEAKQE